MPTGYTSFIENGKAKEITIQQLLLENFSATNS